MKPSSHSSPFLIIVLLCFLFIGSLALPSASQQRENVATRGCFYQVPSGSQILRHHLDGSVDVFDSHKKIEVRFPACSTTHVDER